MKRKPSWGVPCCRECWQLVKDDKDWPEYGCTNPACPCHSPSSEEKPAPNPLELVIAAGEKLERQPSADWEKEFESLVTLMVDTNDGYPWKNTDLDTVLKSFIRKVVEQAREEGFVRGNQSTSEGNKLYYEAGRTAALTEVVEMIEREMKGCDELVIPSYIKSGGLAFEVSYKEGHNAALSDLKQSITKLIEKV
jgi:hypothetical protein